jgi:glutathione S-transferase
MSLVFYTNPQSRGRMVRWMLEETGAPYETVVVNYGPDMKAPDYLAINPMGKVPALVHDGAVITETAGIIAYLADAFPAAGLAPALGSPLRGPYTRWMFFAAGPLEAGIMNQGMGLAVPPGRDRMAGYGTFDQVMNVTAAAVSKTPYLLGDMFSAADLYLGSQIAFGTVFKIIPPRPEFTDYIARIYARPAAARARDIDEKFVVPST